MALAPWVRPLAYCESDPYCQGVLLSRMAAGYINLAPIWDDVRTLEDFGHTVDIVYGGFPCQDLSTAGRKAGLEGERSGLFFELTRLVEETRPSFVFLENIAQGINRYEPIIAAELARCGYTARALKMSAFDVGANHERIRWFCLAHANSLELREPDRRQGGSNWEETEEHFRPSWWAREPGVPGVVDGLPNRMDRLRALGNAVVPAQAREAFMRLTGLK